MRRAVKPAAAAIGLLLLVPTAISSAPEVRPRAARHDTQPAAPGRIGAEPQRRGDPVAGYDALVNAGYVSCGLPYRLYEATFPEPTAGERLPGRRGLNARLPYYLTAVRTPRGVDAVGPNCLGCHAGWMDGRLVIGLGDTVTDYTQDESLYAALSFALMQGDAERAEWVHWYERVRTIGPRTVTRTVGVSPADNVAAVVFAFRDPRTLAWLDAPRLPLPDEVVPLDVPPWWNMRKKNAMFYVGAGRGDHARLMMSAAMMCTDNVAEARAIDSLFPHVRAYIQSIEPPRWPWDVDRALAARGRDVFEETCARCHGTYAPDGGEGDTYPNRVVALHDVRTDRALAERSAIVSSPFVDWYRQSFYGEIARLAPVRGYIAPPLDGVWATAPYLHNGSVPTLAALLESRARPRFWTRSYDSTDYDRFDVGWRYRVLRRGQADEPSASRRRRIYDTTLPGYGNTGHTYGDVLEPDERRALIEYLKTL